MEMLHHFSVREYATLGAGIALIFVILRSQWKRDKKKIWQMILVDLVVLGILFGFIYYEKYLDHIATTSIIQLDEIPTFSDLPYVEINNNHPFFTEEEKELGPFESYSDLDAYGRAQVAFALITPDTLPKEERGPIDSVKPSGWQVSKYDFIENDFLYHRCHLIAYELAAENANEKNLITGTQYMNMEGMRPFENNVSLYVHRTSNSVLYRATPIYKGRNLVASGVLLEAYSIEDEGDGIEFCVYCYNEQPGVVINHNDGSNSIKN